jgi:four helix bundle protein
MQAFCKSRMHLNGGSLSGTASGQRAEIRGQRLEIRQMQISSATELTVYKKAYALAMRVFEISKSFPPEERYSLTDQMRRSSRSVCSNLREGWAKRRYPSHFVSKLTDADGENGETDTWLDFAKDCGYVTVERHNELKAISAEVGKMLGAMIHDPSGFVLTSDR